MRALSLHGLFLPLLTLLGLGTLAAALGTSCSAPVTSGTAAASAPFWLEQIKHQGSAPFNPNPSGYQVFRNVKVSAFPLTVSSSTEVESLFRISELRATVSPTIPRPSSTGSPGMPVYGSLIHFGHSAAISSGNRCGNGCGQSS